MATTSRLEPAILIGDDDPDTTDLLAELIERDEMRPVRAGSVSEALYGLETRPVRFVITDYAMPGENRLMLLRRLGERPAWARISTMMVSGHDCHGDVARAARAHGAGFMAKPLDLTTLRGRCDRRSMHRPRSRPTSRRAQTTPPQCQRAP